MKAEDRWIVSLWQYKSLKVNKNLFPRLTKTIFRTHPHQLPPTSILCTPVQFCQSRIKTKKCCKKWKENQWIQVSLGCD